MDIVTKNLDEIKPYGNNPRNNATAVPAVAKSLQSFGWKQPLVIDKDGVIVVGHTRYLASQKLYEETQDEKWQFVPCLIADDLTEDEITAYRLADNKTAELAIWDDMKLEGELAKIADSEIDMSMFGFDSAALDELVADTSEVVEDDYDEELPEEPKSKLGDIYQLGRHRLLCGDSADTSVIDRLMDGVKAKLLLTDPPYGIKADKGVGGFGSSPKTANKYDDEWDSFTPSKDTFDIILRKADNSIIFGGNYFTDKLPLGKCWLVWDKVGNIQFQNPYSDCELAWTNIERNSVKKYTKIQQGFVADEKEKRVHPTQKPVGMLADILKDFSEENDTILDCFGGSGSTLMACEQLNRKCYMCELDPHYVDVIIDRWEKFTGQKSVKLN